ncbi:MAG TPA: RDD family protein [Candidatus Methylacidiphilales bacterium]|nr:RDD family protein [Candidatus Methylacidiphilales bacterium]
MSWYYHLNGESRGPIDVTELQSLYQSQTISLDTPVWTEGMAQWEPYQNSRAASGTPAATVPTQVCAECGKRFSEEEMLHYENSWVCAACKPLFFQRIKEGAAPIGTFVYASVLRRFVAVFIDGIIIDIFVFLPLFFILGAGGFLLHQGISPLTNVMIIIVEYLFPALYEIIFIGRYGATPGKMVMKIKVVTVDRAPMTYGRSTGRYFSKMLSGIILGIGYLMAIWDEEKRALHDRICKTRVVINDAV